MHTSSTIPARQRFGFVPLGSLGAQPLPGTENASGDTLFWAPDSHRLAFEADKKLKKIDIDGGGVQTLGDAPLLPLPGAWNKDGVILLGSVLDGAFGIVRISDSGGTPVRVTTADPSNGVQLLPKFLPDGRHFLFHILRGDQSGFSGGIYLGSLDSKSATRQELPVATGPNMGAAYAQGYLLFPRDKTLFAQPFDPVRGILGGEPSPLGENVSQNFSVSETGVLVYGAVSGQSGESTASRLSWFDRNGKPAGEVSTPGKVGSIRLFQDGRIALDNVGGLGPDSDGDIWVVDARGVPIKVTSENPNFDGFPVWSPDGMRLAFGSLHRKGLPLIKLYQKSSNGLGAAEPLLLSNADDIALDFPLDWTPNNIVFQRLKPANRASEIWLLSMPEKKTSVYLNNGFNNIQARVSPDGRYLAYATSESGSGSVQIVVQTFPDPKINRWQITANGGSQPVWKPDGRELYYLAPDGKLMAVAVKSGPTFEAGQASELFQTPLRRGQQNPFGNHYAVSNDGQRFLIVSGSNTSATSGDAIPITAIVNWTAMLRKK